LHPCSPSQELQGALSRSIGHVNVPLTRLLVP
jgi:hypothetical protein